MDIVSRGFYDRPTLTVARELLGCFLVCRKGRKIIRMKITEVEAYIGEDDLACHASKGKTKRTEVMYEKAGHAYVYLIYGMYHCMNIVTEAQGFPAAILIRGGEIEGVPVKETNGPGKLCRFLGIDRTFNGWDITKGKKLWIERGEMVAEDRVRMGRRIGVEYAGPCKEYPWRFEIADHSK